MSFRSGNKKYDARAHIAIQDSELGENGGITPESMTKFEEDDEDFRYRGRLDTKLNRESKSLLEGSRVV
uniref:Uncharacterized protein n=1 Tax=Stylophora pistillata TaxID=50429 RepID=A0A2B4RVJ5_STYPI